MAKYAIQEFGVSERQACCTVQFSRCALRYQVKRTTDESLAQQLRQPADKQPHWGCGKMTDYLKTKDMSEPQADPQSVSCLISAFEAKTEKHLPVRVAQTLAVPEQWNQTWSLDFMSDALSPGRAFRT